MGVLVRLVSFSNAIYYFFALNALLSNTFIGAIKVFYIKWFTVCQVIENF